MKTKIAFLVAAILISVSVLRAQHVDITVHFGDDVFALDDENKSLLETWCNKNEKFKDELILLRGHTDSDAALRYNDDLGTKRNETVASVLIAHGFMVDESKSFGETWPLNSNITEEEKATNRRVEVIVLNLDDEKFSHKAAHGVPQIFFRETNKITEFTGKEGTHIKVKTNGLMTKGGNKYTGKVRYELREFYEIEDFLLNKLSTTANGLLLESGGTIEIKCFVSGTNKELIPSPGNPVEIQFANVTPQDSMSIFLGSVMREELMNTTYERLDWQDSIRIDINKGWPSNFNPWMGHQPKSPQPSVGVEEYGINFSEEELERRKKIEAERFGFKMVSIKDFYKSDSVKFRTPSFGWINCDRYSGYPMNMLVNVPFKTDNEGMMEAFLVFPEDLSIMSFTAERGRTLFKNIPQNKKAVLCAFDRSGSKTRFAMQEVECDGNTVYFDFEEKSMDDIRTQLGTLNQYRKINYPNIIKS